MTEVRSLGATSPSGSEPRKWHNVEEREPTVIRSRWTIKWVICHSLSVRKKRSVGSMPPESVGKAAARKQYK